MSVKKYMSISPLGTLVWIAFLAPVARASVFYEFNVVAMTGQAGLTGIEGAPSINDFGRVAFVGDFGDSEGVFVHDPGDWPAQPRNIAPGWGSFDITPGVQINNANRVIGHYRGPGFHNRVGIWDSNAEDSFETVATGYFDLPAADFDVTFPWPSINNNGAAAFSAGLWEGNQLNIYLLRPGSCDYPVPNFCGVTPGGTVLSGIQPLIADDARTVLRFGSSEDSTAPIRVYSSDLSTHTTVAGPPDFTTLGRRPGISDDGKVVAFAADRGNGPGIFLWFDDDPPFIWVIQGDGVPDLAYFSSFEMDTRVAVTRIDLGAEGFEDDSIVVCFMATPNAPGRTNSDELGIWTVRVDIEKVPHATGPIPVVQIGDTLETPSGPRVVTSLAVHDPLANAATDEPHHVAFWAAAGGDDLVVRATREPLWTVLVFLNGDNNLEAAAIDDFLEMATVGSSENLNIVVQFDRHPWSDPPHPGYSDAYGDWTDTRRFQIQPGDDPSVTPVQNLGEVNMGDPASLVDFAVWGITNYPAEHYLLVIWNHGAGWGPREGRGVSWDETDGSDFFTTNQVRDALGEIVTQTGAELDILGFDACLMQMVEVAYSVRESCDYVVGSEELEPGDGWPYDVFLAAIQADSAPQDVCVEIVNAYEAQGYPTLSAFASEGLDGLASTVDRLASELLGGMCGEPANIQQVRQTVELVTFDYDSDGNENADSYVDLAHLCQLLAEQCDAQGIQDAANDVYAALIGARVANETNGAYYAPAAGLSIYFPDHQPDVVGGEDYYANYQNESDTPADLDFVTDTRWDSFIKRYVGQSPCGDVNCDGCVDHADLGILLSDWQCTGGGCPGDCDGDGDTDHGDLGILLAHWGEGCP